MKTIIIAIMLAPALVFGGQIIKTRDGFILPDGSRAYKTRDGYTVGGKGTRYRVTETRNGYLVNEVGIASTNAVVVFDHFHSR